MLLDLDHFKSINDRFGHAVGDRVLEIFADVSSGCLRRIDLFGRLGGEEFAALLRDTTRERALAVAEQIRVAFADATRDVDGRPVAASVSIGIVITQDAVLDLSALLAQADHALYRAKDGGRNRWRSPRSSRFWIVRGAPPPISSGPPSPNRRPKPPPERCAGGTAHLCDGARLKPVHLRLRIC